MRRSWSASAHVALTVGAPLLLLGALAWPLLFSDATFNDDWLNHLWYIWHQSLTIRANHLPSLFLSYSHGIFYPLYAFYGGTIYALTGALSLALGNAPLETYVLRICSGSSPPTRAGAGCPGCSAWGAGWRTLPESSSSPRPHIS